MPRTGLYIQEMGTACIDYHCIARTRHLFSLHLALGQGRFGKVWTGEMHPLPLNVLIGSQHPLYNCRLTSSEH